MGSVFQPWIQILKALHWSLTKGQVLFMPCVYPLRTMLHYAHAHATHRHSQRCSSVLGRILGRRERCRLDRRQLRRRRLPKRRTLSTTLRYAHDATLGYAHARRRLRRCCCPKVEWRIRPQRLELKAARRRRCRRLQRVFVRRPPRDARVVACALALPLRQLHAALGLSAALKRPAELTHAWYFLSRWRLPS